MQNKILYITLAIVLAATHNLRNAMIYSTLFLLGLFQ